MSNSTNIQNSIKLLVVILTLSLIVRVDAGTPELMPGSTPDIYLPIVYREYCGGDGDSLYTCATGPLNSNETRTSYPNDTNDYYYIDLYVPGDIAVIMNNYVGDGQLILRSLEDIEEEDAIDYHSTGGTTQMVNGSNLEIGRYFVQVHTADDWSNTQPYSLTATYPIPTIAITSPQNNGIVVCENDPPTPPNPPDPFCQFEVKGVSSAAKPLNGLRIYVFVFPKVPPGEGWYLQKQWAVVYSNNNWSQSPSYLGNVDNPAQTNHTLKVQAAVVRADASYNGTPLDNLPSPGVVVIENIQGLIAISDPIDLTVQR